MKAPLVIEPVTAENRAELETEQDLDGHRAPLATHLWRRNGRIVGACGVFAPLATFWAHTQLHPREGLDLVDQFQAECRRRAVPFLTACSTDSPFHRLMPRLGYRRLGSLDFYDVP